MHIETLRYLVALQQYGSTRKAAEHLNTSYQNVSRILMQAEEALGSELFERTSKGMVANAKGELTIEAAKSMLEVYDQLLEQLQKNQQTESRSSGLTGKLHLVSSIVVSNGFVNDLLLEFSAQYPKVQVTINEEDGYASITETQGQLYFVPRTTRDLQRQRHLTIPLLEDRMVALVKKPSAFAGQKSISLKRMIKLPMVLIAKDHWEDSVFGRLFQENRLIPQSPLFISSIIGFQKYVGSGQYVGVSTEKISRKLMSDRKRSFEIIPIREKGMELHHCLVISRPNQLTKVEQCFVDFVKEYFRIDETAIKGVSQKELPPVK